MEIVLSTSSGVPLYEQIASQVRTAILTGRLPEGAPLVSLRQLARELQVSLITTTRAYNDLAAEGLIANVPGKGSYVLPIDRAATQAAARAAVRDQLSRTATTAHTAGLTLTDVRTLLEEVWNEHQRG
ncbi:MAG TPA: GntR family transcriptional regulator [Propionicimonas sp.]|nr:GntR family transcriptional regulator [Propionicimonas sp.]